VNGLKHQKEKRSMDPFAGLDVSVKETSVCIVDKMGKIVPDIRHSLSNASSTARSRGEVAKDSRYCAAESPGLPGDVLTLPLASTRSISGSGTRRQGL
jgi:hypothetical protein